MSEFLYNPAGPHIVGLLCRLFTGLYIQNVNSVNHTELEKAKMCSRKRNVNVTEKFVLVELYSGSVRVTLND